MPPKLRWYQYSLRSLLLLTLLASIGMSWVVVRMQQRKRQQAAVQAIVNSGGAVTYDYQLDPSGKTAAGATPPGPEWLRSLLGDDFFANVIMAKVCRDVGLEHIEDLPQLQFLFLDVQQVQLADTEGLPEPPANGTEISDVGLKHIKGLTQLEYLDLRNTQTSDAGLEHLKGLSQLGYLDISNTKITDVSLKHLKELTQLTTLFLRGTKISDAGLKTPQGIAPTQTLGSCGHPNQRCRAGTPQGIAPTRILGPV